MTNPAALAAGGGTGVAGAEAGTDGRAGTDSRTGGEVAGRLDARLACTVEVRAAAGVFEPDSRVLRDSWRGARRLVVAAGSGPDAERLRRYVDVQVSRGTLAGYAWVDADELARLTPLAALERLAREAVAAGLGRRDAFISCCEPEVADRVDVAAALLRRHTHAVRLVHDRSTAAVVLRRGGRTPLAPGRAVRHRQVTLVVPDAPTPRGPADGAPPAGPRVPAPVLARRGSVRHSFEVRLSPGLLSAGAGSDPDPLGELLPPGARVLAVVDAFSPRVVAGVRGYLERRGAAGSRPEPAVLALRSSRHDKTLAQVDRVLAAADRLGLNGGDRILAVGGGTVLDIVGMAALLHEPETPYVRVPTTLVGLIDAGIGLKVGVDVDHRRNLLGGYLSPLACLCDPSFLRTLPAAELRCGLAEAIKIAMVADGPLLDTIEAHHQEFAARPEGPLAARMMRGAIRAMLGQLATNPFERELRRLPDFGHEFGHLLETASAHRLRHGEAVAIGMALSAHLGMQAGRLPAADLERLIRLLLDVGLPVHDELCEPERLWHWLSTSIPAHKGGLPHLVVPTGWGSGGFIDSLRELGPELLARAATELAERQRPGPGQPSVRSGQLADRREPAGRGQPHPGRQEAGR